MSATGTAGVSADVSWPQRVFGSALLHCVRRALRPRSRVALLAWELGGGLGHIRRLSRVGERLSALGYELVFALRSDTNAAMIREAFTSARIVSAPFFRRIVGDHEPLCRSYTDVLYRCGYESSQTLAPLVEAWRRLFVATRADIVICDHSPTVVLAGAGRLPVVHIGSGFATPPAGKNFIAFSPSSPLAPDTTVLAAINELQSRHGTPPLGTVPELLGLADTVTCCLPEVDPYREVRPCPSAGPIDALPRPSADGATDGVFGYLDGDCPATIRVLRQLEAAKISSRIYVRNCRPEWIAEFERTRIQLFREPKEIHAAISMAAAVVHHGGIATAEKALAIGRPQLLLPRNLEQLLTANRIEAMGCGINLHGKKSDPGKLIAQLLRSPVLPVATRGAAARIAARPHSDALNTVVKLCECHVRSR